MQSASYRDMTDEILMGCIAQGNTAAFDELYNRYSMRLLHYFYRMLNKDKEKAQDFLQDLFLKVVEKPDLFDTRQRFSTWIYSIANNMCKNEYRRLQVRINGQAQLGDYMPTEDDYELPYIEQQIDKNLLRKALNESVEQLDDTKRSVFLLRYQENFSIKEIADIMQCSEGTVKSRLFYTVKQLAKQLQYFSICLSSICFV